MTDKQYFFEESESFYKERQRYDPKANAEAKLLQERAKAQAELVGYGHQIANHVAAVNCSPGELLVHYGTRTVNCVPGLWITSCTGGSYDYTTLSRIVLRAATQ